MSLPDGWRFRASDQIAMGVHVRDAHGGDAEQAGHRCRECKRLYKEAVRRALPPANPTTAFHRRKPDAQP